MLFRTPNWCSAALFLITATICPGQTAAEWDSARVNGIAQKLRCPCGCNMPMSCQMPPHPCPTCKKNRIRIYNMLTEGMSEQQILDRYVAEEGAGALWVTPGIAGKAVPYGMLAAGCGVVLLVIRRSLRGRPAQPELDPATLERLQREMADFESRKK
jgi:cytochrome c-type biogenesis protein CcmH/NrfF